MSKWQSGWKIIRSIERCSCIMSDIPFVTIYPKGKIVGRRKGCGPLAVFDNEQDAMSFAYYNFYYKKNGIYQIVRCEYIPSKHLHVWGQNTKKVHIRHLPISTVLADKVKCLE